MWSSKGLYFWRWQEGFEGCESSNLDAKCLRGRQAHRLNANLREYTIILLACSPDSIEGILIPETRCCQKGLSRASTRRGCPLRPDSLIAHLGTLVSIRRFKVSFVWPQLLVVDCFIGGLVRWFGIVAWPLKRISTSHAICLKASIFKDSR